MIQHKTTAIVATPSEYFTWFQQPMNMLSSCDAWRFAFCCGENMSSAVVRKFAAQGIGNLQLVTVYGLTETSIACCMGLVEYKEYSADKEGKLIPAGSVLPDYQLWVGDHLGRLIPPVWTGCIWIAGPSVSGGYFGADNVDEHWFQTTETGASSFRTGDTGFMNDNGVLFVVSRRLDKSVALVRGYNFELGDISRAIIDKSNGKVAEAVVIIREEHDEEEPHIVAFIVMATASGAESPRYLQGILRGLNLPAYMRPTRAVIRESLPRTKNGKTDRAL
jgi:acyl-CoA synthetase (AMP-forming)/AMP-acid ligase II